jgi:Peptidase family M28
MEKGCILLLPGDLSNFCWIFHQQIAMDIKALCSIAAFVVIGLLSCAQKSPEEKRKPTVAQKTIPRFDGNSAFAFLKKQTSFGPRTPNSPGHAACLTSIASTLQGNGASVDLQSFRIEGYGKESLSLTNIIARFNPSNPDRILLCAHWDTRPRSDQDPDPAKRSEPIPGANDGASGVAVLMEIARLMQTTPASIGVDMVMFDGEDYGLEGDLNYYFLGAKYFAHHKPADYAPRFGILLDMVGDADLQIPREQNSITLAPDIVDMVWSTARSLGVWQFTDDTGPAISDDHLVLNEVGIKTVDLIDFDYPYWHTTQDTPDHCSAESLTAVGTVITHIVYTRR